MKCWVALSSRPSEIHQTQQPQRHRRRVRLARERLQFRDRRVVLLGGQEQQGIVEKIGGRVSRSASACASASGPAESPDKTRARHSPIVISRRASLESSGVEIECGGEAFDGGRRIVRAQGREPLHPQRRGG